MEPWVIPWCPPPRAALPHPVQPQPQRAHRPGGVAKCSGSWLI